MELSERSNGDGGSSRSPSKWRCDVCKAEISTAGGLTHILRHLNARQLQKRHELRHDEICEKDPRVGWCEGCKKFINNKNKVIHLQIECSATPGM